MTYVVCYSLNIGSCSIIFHGRRFDFLCWYSIHWHAFRFGKHLFGERKKRRFGILHSQSFSFYTNDFASIEIPTVSAWQCHIPFRFFWVPGMSICTPSRHERYVIDYMCNWSVLFSLSIDSPKITTATMRWNFLRFVFSSPHAHVVR